MYVIKRNGVPIKLWADGVEVDHASQEQLSKMSEMPFIFKHIAVMPDVHLGKGATVGSVIPTKGAIIPAAVGVDIGCGMMAQRTNLTANDIPGFLGKLRGDIEDAIPLGAGAARERVSTAWLDLSRRYDALCDKFPGVFHKAAAAQLGTLGSGNHFIELCLDEENFVWVMLHSGSRGPGNKIGQQFIELAKMDMRRHFINLPDVDLAYLPEGTDYFNDYVEAVSWAQEYAFRNRAVMFNVITSVLSKHFDSLCFTESAINCHHNYIERENHYGTNVWVTRKGAVRARQGDLGIIPGSMGAKSFIVRGKGNAESFMSCSHGAGRVHSRGAAKRLFSVEDHAKATEGVECRKDAGVLDETPAAYKDIDAVMAAQSDLVEVVHTLKQFLCVKG